MIGLRKAFKCVIFTVFIAGVSACSDEDFVLDPSLNMAGNANYTVSGTIKDEHGNPLENIRVATSFSLGIDLHRIERDTLYSGQDGKFSKFYMTYPPFSVTFKFEDIDGSSSGGAFKTAEMTAAPIQTEKSSGSFMGSYSITADIVLERTKQLSEENK